MQEYLEFTKCPQRFEMGARAGGKSQRDEIKLYRAIDLATSSAMHALRDDPQRRQEGAWQVAVNEALEKFDLVKQPAAVSIAQRVTERVRNGVGFLAEGGKTGVTVNLPLGPLQGALTPDQVFEGGGTGTLRFFRNSRPAVRQRRSSTPSWPMGGSCPWARSSRRLARSTSRSRRTCARGTFPPRLFSPVPV